MSKEYNIINATASAFKRCCAKSFKNGRAGRAEFWWFILGQYAVMVVLSGFIEIMRILLDFMLIMEVLDLVWRWIFAVFVLLLVITAVLIYSIPALGLMIRRLHDINRSGWNILWSFLPMVGQIYLLVLFCKKGDDCPNEYGDAPNAPLELKSGVLLKLQNFFSTH